MICSDAFKTTAEAMAEVQGAPGYRYLTTPHPVAAAPAATASSSRRRSGRDPKASLSSRSSGWYRAIMVRPPARPGR